MPSLKSFAEMEYFDADLIDHARSALGKVHQTIAQKEAKTSQGREESGPESTSAKSSLGNSQKKKTTDKKKKDGKKAIQYISVKEPPKRTVFYEHSRQGMKYWYEDKASKPFYSKSILGRTGTLLGLVDAPYK